MARARMEMRKSAWWTSVVFVPLSGVAFLLMVWSVHVLPVAFLFVGAPIVWPWMLVSGGRPFDPGWLFVSLLVQWVWCFVLIEVTNPRMVQRSAWTICDRVTCRCT